MLLHFLKRPLRLVMNYTNVFKLALLITFAVVSYLVFSKPNYPIYFTNMDKLGHAGSFFALSYLAYYAFKPKWYWLASILSLYAMMIEVIQSMLPYRRASIADVAADLAGITFFYLCLMLYSNVKDWYQTKAKTSD
ncbi:VanZ family protein [Shewanella intestini]|uniref:VanZ family protein n=1 Tax=Shewanella intestini TaxID=2017544 RepID=A0ABS5I637_9GAMM|nr:MULTISPECIES: VanZ family protein [Shewanella]MBR9729481.1 VanZ family protein [Shewanella intestini]MRG35058.1 VanZ family protein [Shewanella sp. XMDDZSB0408]